MYKIDNQQGPTVQHREKCIKCIIINYKEKESEQENIHIFMTESLDTWNIQYWISTVTQ